MKYNSYKKISFIKNLFDMSSGSSNTKWYVLMFMTNIMFVLFVHTRYVYIVNPKIVSIQKIENNTTEEKNYNNVEKRSIVNKNKTYLLSIEYFDKDSNTIKETVLYDISIINTYNKTKVLPSIKNRNVDDMFYASIWITFVIILLFIIRKWVNDEDYDEISTFIISICFLAYILICFIYVLVEL